MRFTRTSLVCMFLFLLGAVPFVHAQRVDEIEIGETKNAALTATNVVSFFFNAEADQVLTVQLTTTSEGFTPVLMVATSDNDVLETFSASPGANTVGGTLTIPADGRYFVQVQGANSTRGDFTLALLEGDMALATPESSTTIPIQVSREELSLDTTTQAQLSESDPEKQYTFSGGEVPLVVQVIDGSTEGSGDAFTVTLTDGASGEIIGNYQAVLVGGAFVVPPSPGDYILTLHHEGGQPQTVSISLFEFGGTTFNPEVSPAVQATLTVAPTENALPGSTPASPEDVDVLLRWGNTFLTVSNVSDTPIDVRTLAFAGNNRRADMAYWLQSTPELDLSAFPPNACGGFRPLANPEVPPLPPDCNELAAWWSADIVFFWGGTEFDVLYNGLVVATCATNLGQCGVDLPSV